MKHNPARSGSLVAAVALAVAVLTGCAPATNLSSSSPAPSGSESAHPTPTPAPTGLGPLPGNALFRITAKGIQPNGATVDLVETVYAATAISASDIALLNAQCREPGPSAFWKSGLSAGYLGIVASMSATLEASTPTFDASAQIGAFFGDVPVASSGDYQTAQADCAPGYFKAVPGIIHAIIPVSAADPATGKNGWGTTDSRYGFEGSGNDPDDPNNSATDKTVVKDCAIEISSAALAAVPAIASWQTQAYSLDKGCAYTVS